jgi:hypothetical protein
MTANAVKLKVRNGGRGQKLVDGKVCSARFRRGAATNKFRDQESALKIAMAIGSEQEDKQTAKMKARARPDEVFPIIVQRQPEYTCS